MQKAVFLDRDGVLNKNVAEHHYVTSWEEFEILPGVFEALDYLKRMGYRLIVISNQRGISRGMLTHEDISSIHSKFNKMVKEKTGSEIDALYYCPHGYDDNCNCRKPKIGMLLDAKKDFDIDFGTSWYVGDRESDRKCAQNANVRVVMIPMDGSLLNAVKSTIYPKDFLQIVGDYEAFLDTVLKHTSKLPLDPKQFQIDHIAYRSPTKRNYDEMKKIIEGYGKLLGENVISKRPIAVFELLFPLIYEGFEIPYFELLAPKPVHKHINGLQHLEFVVKGGVKALLKRHPELSFDTEDIGREINPEIEIDFDDGTEIKFHNMPINEALEKQKKSGKL
jgi:D-glycero-D-manno-heptose 1,7-bisphosphate phosphatase